jgi:hypothetical protein
MARILFDVFFVLSLVLPCLAVVAGALTLLLPTRTGTAVVAHRHAHV